jgi:hypothetical protein
MKHPFLILSLTLATAAGAGTLLAQQSAAKPSMTVYKSPTCGCCSNWITHLQRSGFDVKPVNVDDIDAVKRTYGVPAELGSCHTGLVNGYVIEGHIPADVVHRFLREKPAGAAGIAVPGMPAGSPGMEMGARKDPYNIMVFDKAGKSSVFEKR